MSVHGEKTKVLIVDDSASMRKFLSEILATDSRIEVIGTAADPYIAREKIKTKSPDVLTLDVEMPGMNGLDFLEKIMRLRPMPVVMVSSLTKKGANSTLRALELGAFDFVTKPEFGANNSLEEFAESICATVKAAATAHIYGSSQSDHGAKQVKVHNLKDISCRESVIVIGASAGGTEAIREILQGLPEDVPGIAVVQHMPANFTALFAERLNNQCALYVKEAKNGDKILRGQVLIAPGGKQMEILAGNPGYSVKVYDGAPVNRHAPSVDVLFNSTAITAGNDALGIILTGMGRDGAKGMLEMKRAGAYTIAQNRESCVVFGMPDQAINCGAVTSVVELSRIPEHIVNYISYKYENNTPNHRHY